jgi:prepilin-type N-terminal cleavage/methylation domain-containing protein
MLPIHHSGNNQKGVTLIEVVVATLLFAIFIAGIGYLSRSVIPTQRGLKANAIQLNGVRLYDQLILDIRSADVITFPAEPTDDTEIISSTYLNMQVLAKNPKGGPLIRRYVSYSISGNQILRCQGAAGGATCTPTEELLNSWNNGQIKAESGTRFIRGIDADNDGALSKRERQIIRAELVLSQNEGPYGKDEKVYQRDFYIEGLSNVNNSQTVN